MAKKFDFKKEEIENILVAGGRLSEIMDFYGCSRAAAWRAIKKFDLKYERVLDSGLDKLYLKDLISKNKSIDDISKLCNCSRSKVWRAIQKFQLEYSRPTKITKNDLQGFLNIGKTPSEISDLCKCRAAIVYSLIKKFNFKINPRQHFSIHPEICLTDLQRDVLVGSLLGDGHITKKIKSNNCRFIYGTSIENHTKFIGSFFYDYLTPATKDKPRYRRRFSKETNKEYHSYFIDTQSNITFTKLRDVWYKNNIKKIPNDLKLNSNICLVWYIGDGSICRSNGCITLSTESFKKEDLEYVILPQLKRFEARLNISHKKYFRVVIPHRRTKEFLDYIGDCPIKEMKYKWDVVEYKRKGRKLNE